MFASGVNSATAMRLARYQAEALQQVDQSAARIASNRRFTTFAEDTVAATQEISLRGQRGQVGQYLLTTQNAKAAADAAAGGLQQASDILGKMREAVLGVTEDNYEVVNASLAEWAAQLTRISATTTSLDGKTLLDGGAGADFTVANGDTLNVKGIDLKPATLGVDTATIAFTTGDTTERGTILTAINDAIDDVSASLATTSGMASAMGYHLNAITTQVSSIDAAIENLVSVDVAEETLKMTQNSLRAEASAAMLAQVNALHYSMVRQLLMAR